jgi:hypothetical protein
MAEDETTPDPPADTNSGGGRRRASAAAEGVGAPAAPEVLTVGYFTHRDPILGGSRERLGVVVAVDGDRLHVVPLEHYRVEVDPAEFEPVTTAADADDLT